MTDQVSSTVSLASGLPVVFTKTATAGSPPGNGGPAEIADSSSQGQGGPAVGTPTGSPDQAVEQINNHLQQASTQLRIQVDADTGRTVYKVMDPTTGQVLLQVPSAGVLAMAHALQSLDKQAAGASGVLVDKQG